MRVLYVEDNTTDVEIVQSELRQADADLVFKAVFSLAQAREHLAEHASDYDVFVVDMRLPDGSGLNLVNEIRQMGLKTPVMVLTSTGNEASAIAALHAGADDYQVKTPGFAHRLPAALQELISYHHRVAWRWQKPLRVLYAENNITDIDLTRRFFASEAPHIQLSVVRRGSEVIQRLAQAVDGERDWDVLLLDYGLSDRDAIDILREIRHHYALDVPVIVVTGQGDERIAAAAMRFGAADYLVKHPGYLVKLPFAIENAYYRHQLAREREALQASEKRFRLLAENARDILFRFDFYPTPHLSYVSPAVHEVLGYTPQELLANPEIILQIVSPDNQAPIPELIHQRVFDGQVPQPVRLVHKKGRTVWTEQRSRAIYDDEGRLIAIEGVARDVTEQKQAQDLLQQYYERLEEMVEERTQELKKAYQTLHEHERLGLLGDVAAGVGRELRNPLSVITNAVYYLRLIQSDSDPKIREYLDIIADEIKKATHIIQRLVELSRAKEVHPQAISVASIVTTVVTSFDLPANVQMQVNIPADLPSLWVDPQHIDQALSHLISNAIEAMPEGGRITISAALCEEDAEQGPMLCLQVQDCGEGIPSELHAKVFEPLYSTRLHGMGLGLALVKNLVETNQGWVTLQSEEGRGTTVNMYLPLRS